MTYLSGNLISMKILLFILLSLLIPSIAIASASSLGEIAENLMEPVTIVSDFIGTASIIVGICSLFGAFLRYMQHRVNPMVAPISTIFLLIAMGLALIGLPFIYLLVEGGIPYHLL